MRGQFAKTMLSVGLSDQRLVVLVGDIGAFGLRDFAAQCPGRFFNVGIREQAMASIAAGFSQTGFIPVIHSITPFVVERCFEQIKDDFCYQETPGNVVSVGGGIDYAALGGTHHSYSDIALMKSLPGTQVFCPGSQREFDLLFRENYACGKLNYFRLGGVNHSVEFDGGDKITAGKAYVVRPGKNWTIVTTGSLLTEVMKAAQSLDQQGISCQVVHNPTIKPIDADGIRRAASKTGRVAVVEDHNVIGGLGDEVRRVIDGRNRVLSLGIQDSFQREYGNWDHLLGLVGLNEAGIVRSILKAAKDEK
jgi:transketolase